MKRALTLAAAGLAAASLGGAASAKDVLKMATIAPGTSAYLTMTTMANVVNQGRTPTNCRWIPPVPRPNTSSRWPRASWTW